MKWSHADLFQATIHILAKQKHADGGPWVSQHLELNRKLEAWRGPFHLSAMESWAQLVDAKPACVLEPVNLEPEVITMQPVQSIAAGGAAPLKTFKLIEVARSILESVPLNPYCCVYIATGGFAGLTESPARSHSPRRSHSLSHSQQLRRRDGLWAVAVAVAVCFIVLGPGPGSASFGFGPGPPGPGHQGHSPVPERAIV